MPKIGVANPTLSLEALVDADLDTRVTALYVKVGGILVKDRRPGHPVRLSQAGLVCLAVAQALRGFDSEHRWIRFAICHLRGCFPCLPHQPGCNKRREDDLIGVSCVSANECIAAGSSTQDSSSTLAERWDGTQWAVLPVPSPTASASLAGVSCTSATAWTVQPTPSLARPP